jgi:hypothetical protein
METATTVKRPRGRPRLDAPPRVVVNVRLRPEVRAQLERDAKRATRSVAKEISIRIEKSYVRDESFGGSQMSSMFREMAAEALGVERQNNRGSLFEDFETFVVVMGIWGKIIQSRMPRPADELLAEIGRNWDAFKAGAPQPPAQQAARELIIHSRMTRPADELLAEIGRKWHVFKLGSPQPAAQQAAREWIQGSYANSVSVSLIGHLDMVIQHLTPSKGSARAAAREISRLAERIAEMTEGEAAGDNAVPPVEPDNSSAAARGE